ncbi:unnamed protein product [Notodromas monacha]|uniref:Protein kinase domain-containing protein n=1 Tax=Notodromas monacha TaxID=399045 RepID=A0A7R9BIG4_9CRUS|nr:unnamed protein product [Notodromas monacha]CAG0915317.1 unnamed protein product [Notodromas monacha]
MENTSGIHPGISNADNEQNLEEDPGVVSDSEFTAVLGYFLSGKIGEGSFAVVRMAEFRTVASRDVLACKIIDLAKCPMEYIERFLPREMGIWPEVRHRNLIGVHSILEHGSRIYVFMEYAPNGDLLDYVMQCGRLSEQQANVWSRQMGEGVDYLHSRDIAHRDLKCENMLITNNWNVRIGDFGFVTKTFDNGERVLSKTFCGSLAYAAPELIRGDPYDARQADAWSLGIVLYVMFNASMPFDDSDMKQLLLDQEAKHWRLTKPARAYLTMDAISVLDGLLEPRELKRLTVANMLKQKWYSTLNTRLSDPKTWANNNTKTHQASIHPNGAKGSNSPTVSPQNRGSKSPPPGTK